MIDIMTAQNDNESNQLAFPIQKVDYESESICDVSLIQSVRLDATKLLNQIAAGEKTLDLEGYNAIKGANEIFAFVGYPPIISTEELDTLM